MAKLSIECKKLMTEELAATLKKARLLVVTNYKGLSSQDLNELRKALRDAEAGYLVVKTSMAKRALTETSQKKILDMMSGEVGIAFDEREDPSFISKTLMKFAKDHEVLKICGGTVGEDVLTEEDIKSIAALPSREVLLGKLANVLNAPMQGLAGALNQILSKIVYALNAVKEKKEKEPVGQSEEKAEAEAEEGPKAGEKKEGTKEETKEAGASENKEEDNESAQEQKGTSAQAE